MAAALVLAGCLPATPTSKNEAWDGSVLDRQAVSGTGLEASGQAWQVHSGPHWLRGLTGVPALVFARYRPPGEQAYFALVLDADAELDRLSLLPLGQQTPLALLRDAGMAASLRAHAEARQAPESVTLPLSETLQEGRLGMPLAPPRRIYAAGTNFPSHLIHDLALTDPALPALLARSRARMFVKYPPTPPPGGTGDETLPTGLIGPFDRVEFPSSVAIPGGGSALTHVDYEVEIGAVIGASLDAGQVADMDDRTLLAQVAGYVLLGDTKARNPQVMGKILSIDQPAPADAAPYLLGDPDLDEALGYWGAETAQWWSYAASWGNYASVGPFFVVPFATAEPRPRQIISARSFGSPETRGQPVPAEALADTLYLRQAAVVDHGEPARDPMIWSVADMIRSILAPDNALAFMGSERRLEEGDIIALGTPAGVVITSRPYWMLAAAEDLVFWRSARAWHDQFFGADTGLYLWPGDQVFYWADGLGYQLLELRRLP